MTMIQALQRLSSEISGTIFDSTNAVIPGAAVTVLNTDINMTRSVRTDGEGHYSVGGLIPGLYTIRAEAAGFGVVIQRRAVVVNDAIRLNITLPVATVTDEVEVRSFPADVDGVALSGVVNEENLHTLPLNGRDLFQLVNLQTGVVPITNGGPNPWAEGATGKAAVQGSRPTMNNLTLDGGDINDPGYNNPAGGPSGSQLGVEAVREFRVLLNSYGAEFGRNGGANVQFVSKSGSNDFHGTLYEFHRNSAVDARNFFDASDNPPLIRHQYGGSLGGPLARNKTFFWGNFEGLAENKSVRSTITVPDLGARAGRLPSASDPSSTADIGVDARVQPLLVLYPEPNGETLGNGTALFRTSRAQETDERYGLLRIDHVMSAGGNLFGRYVIDDGQAAVPFQSTLVPGFDGRRETRNQSFMLGWLDFPKPDLINELKFHFSRIRLAAVPDNQHSVSVSLLPDRPLGGINITGLPLLGNNIVFPVVSASNTFELIDNLTHERGAQKLQIGVDLKRLHLNGPFDVAANGQYRFSDLSAFGIPTFSNNAPLEFFLRAIPLLYIGVSPEAADSNRGYRQSYTGLYAQNAWRIRDRVSLQFGIRWEYWTNPTEVNGRAANIRSVATDVTPTVGPIWERVPLDLFSPRVGVAWSLGSGPAAVVRAGAGVFRDQLWGNIYSNTRFYAPFYKPVLTLFPNFLTPPTVSSLGGLPTPPAGSFGVTYQPDFPYYLKYSLSVRKPVGAQLFMDVAFAGARGIHLPRAGETNLTPRGPVNPNFGSLPFIVTDANSFYNSLQLALTKTMRRNLSLQASYTLSKSIDDQSGIFPSDWVSESGVSQNFFDRTGDRARSSFDRRHVFVANFVYDLPNPQLSNAASAVLRNWQLSGIWTQMSGLPFTANLGTFNNSLTNASNPADRPDLKSGVDPCNTADQRPERWFDASIFRLPLPGQYGNAGRNIMCGPDFASLDVSLTKSFALGDKASLRFRVEMFNAFNRTNLSPPVNTQGAAGFGGNGDAVFVGRRVVGCDPLADASGCGIPATDAGRIFSTAGNSRQFQFALRIIF